MEYKAASGCLFARCFASFDETIQTLSMFIPLVSVDRWCPLWYHNLKGICPVFCVDSRRFLRPVAGVFFRPARVERFDTAFELI